MGWDGMGWDGMGRRSSGRLYTTSSLVRLFIVGGNGSPRQMIPYSVSYAYPSHCSAWRAPSASLAGHSSVSRYDVKP